MVRIIDLDEDSTVDSQDAFGWWTITAVHCEQFFKTVSHFETQQISAEYLIKLQMLYIRIERSPYPQKAARARNILLNSMFAAISATTATLNGENNKSRQNMNAALTNLQHLKHELLTLGVRAL
jgi:hypothetical protein